MTAGLLDGFRVLDLSRVLAGPYAAQVMAEMGADVVKGEPPGGDPARDIGPHLGGRSVYFSSLNTGKRGMVLDLADPARRPVLDSLLGWADVVLHNFRPATAAALGVDPAALLAARPDLVVVTVTGYAATSERSGEPAFDLTIQAESGIMAVTGEPGRPPVRAGVAVADLVTGLWAAFGAVAALLARTRTGAGRHVEVAMVDATLPLLSYMATTALVRDEDPPKVGAGHHEVCPYGAFPVTDGWIVVAVLNDKFWPALCRALDRPALAAEARFGANAGRLAARDEVEAAVAEALCKLSTAEALARLAGADVPAAPVAGVLEALRSPYVASRGFVTELSTAEGPYSVVEGPLRGGAPLRPAPDLGQHTEEILAEICRP